MNEPRRGAAAAIACALLLAGCSGSSTTVGSPPGAPGRVAPSPGASTSGAPVGPTPSAAPATPAATATPGAGPAPSPAATVPFPAATDGDPFYAQPSPFPKVAAGTIFASRSVTYAPSGGVALTNKAWELKYASQGVNGPLAAVATVVLPLTPVSSTPPLVMDALAEDGLGAQCAPSHDLTGSTVDSNEQLEANEAQYALGLGWVVVFPDHEGPASDYATGPNGGYITLDGIRAALHFAPLGLTSHTQVGLYGYSGGAIAEAWAASLQRSYAPELDIVASASGGTPADPKGIIENIDTNQVSNAAFFSLILSAVIGTNRVYPTLLGGILNAKGLATAKSLANGCLGNTTDGSPTPTGTLSDYTTINDPVDSPQADALYPEITLAAPGLTPVTKMFVFHSQVDELIPIGGPDRMVSEWCAAGAKVAYYRGVQGDHVAFEADTAPAAFAYLASVFENTTAVTPPGTTTCNE